MREGERESNSSKRFLCSSHNVKHTHTMSSSLSLSSKKYVNVLENAIEWVVPPPAGRKCAYVICPFPFNGNDEDNLPIDQEIPIVVDDLEEFDFKLPKKTTLGEKTDPNVIDIDTIEIVIEKWSNSGPKVLQEQRVEALALYGTTSDLLHRYTRSFEGGARTTLNINELQDVLHMLSTVAKDGRVSSPIFRRQRASTGGSLLAGQELEVFRRSTVAKRTGSVFVSSDDANPLSKSLFDKRKKKTGSVFVSNPNGANPLFDSTHPSSGHAGEEEEKKKTKTKKKKKKTTKEEAAPEEAAPEEAPDEAPEGWTIVFSEEHGMNYYRNIKTMKKVWDRPEADLSEGGEEEEAPKGWTIVFSEDHDRHYYRNIQTKKKVWDRPEDEEDEEEEAPEGWTIMFSEEHNANYYRNIRTKKKVWDRPEAEKKRRKKTRGWSTVSQGAKSAPYFVNDHTGESTWDPPTLPAAPEGWSVHAHGDHHYFQDDVGGGATQWHHPHDDAPPGVV